MSFMQKLMGGGDRALIGLDISSSAIKLLELGRKGSGHEVLSFAVEPLPANAVVDQQIAEPEVVAQAIQRAIGKAGTRQRNVALSVSGPSVITKTIQMSSRLSEDDMEQMIRAEADQYIPYPIEEVSLDFQVLGPAATGDDVDVLLAACRSEQLEQRTMVARLAGLTPKVVDIEPNALENAAQLLAPQLQDGGRNHTVALIDIGANNTSMLFLHDLRTVYSRSVAFGGRQLTEDIMRNFGMSFEEAGRAKRGGSLPDNYQDDVLKPFLTDLQQQIDRGLQFFFSAAAQFTSVDQIVLAGGCAQIPDIAPFIQDRLGIPTVVAKPFGGMTVSSRARSQHLMRDEAALMLASGLALRAFDPPEA